MRGEIDKYLGTVTQATAKMVSDNTGIPHEEAAKELHKMHAEGLLEREMTDKKKYVYWPSTSPRAETPSVAMQVPSSVVAKPEAETVNTDSEKAFSKLAEQTRELLEVFGLPPTMTEAIAAARTMMEIARATSIDRDELRAEVESLKTGNARLKQNNAELERRIDELTLGPVGSKSPLFVTVGRYAKPMRHDSLEKAQKRGKALVRNEKESEVLVCEPVGRVVRGTEWVTR